MICPKFQTPNSHKKFEGLFREPKRVHNDTIIKLQMAIAYVNKPTFEPVENPKESKDFYILHAYASCRKSLSQSLSDSCNACLVQKRHFAETLQLKQGDKFNFFAQIFRCKHGVPQTHSSGQPKH